MKSTKEVKKLLEKHMAFSSIRSARDHVVAVKKGFSTKPRAMSESTQVTRVFSEVFGSGIKVHVDYPHLPGNRLANVADYTITLTVPVE